MLNSFFHILLAFVLCFTASSIPVRIDALNFISLPSISVHQKAEYRFNIEKTDLKNPSTAVLQIKSDDFNLELDQLTSTLQLDIIQKDSTLSTLQHKDFIENILQSPDEKSQILALTMNLEQKHLNLSDGNYIFRIYSTAKELKNTEPINLNIEYAPISPYVPAAKKEPKRMMGMTLYFPDSSGKYLIPISRFAPYTRIPIRTTIDNLREGSDPVLGFKCPVPEIKKLQVRKDMVIVHLPADLGEYNQDAKKGTIAVNSFVNSLTSLPGINRVKFLLNGKESDQIFNRYSTDMIFERDKNPKIYLAMDRNKKRLLLVPNSFKVSDENKLVQEMFSSLKTAKIQEKSLSNLIAPIPEDVKLIDFSQKGNVLTLNLSKEFLNAYTDRPDLQRLMLDSILYSFTSINKVDKVKILVDNQRISDFAGTNISTSLKKPAFINPEKE
jgi:spore germination protein GerM